MIGQYVGIITASKTRMGIVMAARFDGGRVSLLFHQDPDLPINSPIRGCRTPNLKSAHGLQMSKWKG